jgi:hypothetical protein
MPSQQFPASVRKAVCALYVATALAAVSVAVIVGVEATDNNLAEHLREAYPQRAADEIEMAESSILTYLFTLAALGAFRHAAATLHQACRIREISVVSNGSMSLRCTRSPRSRPGIAARRHTRPLQ